MSRPQRLRSFAYPGSFAYSLTMCTAGREQRFVSPAIVTCVLEQLLRTATDYLMAVLAYCFIPDHLHLLLQGLDDSAGLPRFTKVFRQRAAIEYRRRTGERLWQPGYYECTLRCEDNLALTATYIAANPVRAGLAAAIDQWTFTGGVLLKER